jgi:hypothetical protein
MTELEFKVGDKIKVIDLPPYLKTAEPMPMLRPSSLIQLGEEGVIISLNPGNYCGIRFPQGAFFLDSKYIEKV